LTITGSNTVQRLAHRELNDHLILPGIPGRSSGISSVGSVLSFKPKSSVPEASACNETAVMLDLDSKSGKSCVVLWSSTAVLVASVLDAGRSPVDRLCTDDIGPCVSMTGCASEDCGTWERSDGTCIAAIGVAVSDRGISQGGGVVRTSGEAGF